MSLLVFQSVKKNLLFRTTPLASFYDARQGTIKMDYNPGKKSMITVGTDRTIKVNVRFQKYFFLIDYSPLGLEYGKCCVKRKTRFWLSFASFLSLLNQQLPHRFYFENLFIFFLSFSLIDFLLVL